MRVAKYLYRPRSRRWTDDDRDAAVLAYQADESLRWYAEQAERAREAQHRARLNGWGLAARFPAEAMEVE